MSKSIRRTAKVACLHLGEILAVARECKGWSIRDLEAKTGISNPLISQIENGDVSTSFVNVVRLCDALGLPVERAASTVRPRYEMLRTPATEKKEG